MPRHSRRCAPTTNKRVIEHQPHHSVACLTAIHAACPCPSRARARVRKFAVECECWLRDMARSTSHEWWRRTWTRRQPACSSRRSREGTRASKPRWPPQPLLPPTSAESLAPSLLTVEADARMRQGQEAVARRPPYTCLQSVTSAAWHQRRTEGGLTAEHASRVYLFPTRRTSAC
jgi:hypothetical protein